jgi:hypothetical protein
LSYVVSVVAAVRHFGKWQQNAWGILYSCCIGAALGTLIGLATGERAVLAICLFMGIMWVDRCSAFDAISRVLSLLLVILGALFPTLSNNEVMGVKSFITLLLIMYIPFAAIGVTLLFPFPALAADDAKRSVGRVCGLVDRLVRAQTQAYCNLDLREFYLSDAETTVDELLLPEIELLEELTPLIEYEAVVFPSLRHLAPSIRFLIGIVRSILVHANLQRNLIRKSVDNATHAVFLYHLEPVLDSISTDIGQALSTVCVHVRDANRTCVDVYYESCGQAAALVLAQLHDCCRLLLGSWSLTMYSGLDLGVWAATASASVAWPWRGRREVDAFAVRHRRRVPERLSSSRRACTTGASTADVVYTAVDSVGDAQSAATGTDVDLLSAIEMGHAVGAGAVAGNGVITGTVGFDALVAGMEVKKANLLYGYHTLRQVFVYREYHLWPHYHSSYCQHSGPAGGSFRAARHLGIGVGCGESVLNGQSPVADLEVLGSRVAFDNNALGLLNLG